MNHYELIAILSGRFAENEIDGVILRMEDVLKRKCYYSLSSESGSKVLSVSDKKLNSTGTIFWLGPTALDRTSKKSTDSWRFPRMFCATAFSEKKSVGVPKIFDRKPTLEQGVRKRPERACSDRLPILLNLWARSKLHPHRLSAEHSSTPQNPPRSNRPLNRR